MKRKVGSTSTLEGPTKKLKEVGASTDVETEIIQELDPIQAKLVGLDDECVKEQLKVQRKFADKMRPLYLERQKIFSKIPNFWSRVISNIPIAEMSFCEEDAGILQHLNSVDLEDNLDEKGSYKLTFVFRPEISQYFEPHTLEKTVLFDDKGIETSSTVTKIKWKDDRNYVKSIQSRRKEAKRNLDSVSDEEEDEEYSILEWFCETPSPDCIPLGDIFRRDIWQNPFLYLYPSADFDSGENDDEDEEEDTKDDETTDE